MKIQRHQKYWKIVKEKSEDLIMFRKFWPEVIAKKIERIYQKSEKSNEVK